MVFSLLSHLPPLFPSKLTLQKEAAFLLSELTCSKIFIKTVHLNTQVYLKAAHRASEIFNARNFCYRIETYKISQEKGGEMVGFFFFLSDFGQLVA